MRLAVVGDYISSVSLRENFEHALHHLLDENARQLAHSETVSPG